MEARFTELLLEPLQESLEAAGFIELFRGTTDIGDEAIYQRQESDGSWFQIDLGHRPSALQVWAKFQWIPPVGVDEISCDLHYHGTSTQLPELKDEQFTGFVEEVQSWLAEYPRTLLPQDVPQD